MKKILALVLAVLMVATTCVAMVTVSAADTTPVKIYDGDALTATGRAYCVGGTYSYKLGLTRYTWFPQGGPIDPQFTLHDASWGALTVAPYLVIKYKTTTAGLTGGAFIGNGTIGQSFITWNYSNSTGEWDTVMLYLPDLEPMEDYYDLSNNQITHFRWEVVENANDFPDGSLDVEYVAFFETEEDAQNFKHENKPADPDTAVGGSYLTFDFSTVTDPSTVLRVEGHTGTYGNQMSASLVDGALRITATGNDPYVVLLNNGSEELGLSGKKAHYILVKYKATSTVETPVINFFSNVPGIAGWGGAGSYTNTNDQDVLTADGNWHYIMVDATNAWGNHDSMLNAFRLDALDNANAGDTIDIASIKFFTTSDWVSEYIAGIAATDAAAKEMGLAYGWITEEEDTETETEPPAPAISFGDLNQDGKLNSKDLTRMKKLLAGDSSFECPEADMNEDGKYNSKDLTRLKKALAGA